MTRPVTIRAIAHALPVGVLSNDDLASRFGAKQMEAVARMTGIVTRRIAEIDQCASDLAFAAAVRLIGHLSIDPRSIDLLLFTSQTPDYRTPATACALHGRLGLSEDCCAFDINQACSGYIHALKTAHAMVAAGTANRALLLNADTLSKLVHPEDRGLVALTGDAGVATLVEPGAEGYGIERIRICTDGSQFARLVVPAGGCRQPASEQSRTPVTDGKGNIRSDDTLFMDGPAIFHFSVYKIPEFISSTLAAWGQTLAEFDLVLLHQANKAMVDLIYKSLRASPSQQFLNIGEVGNTAGAALPCLLAQAWREGRIKPGSRTLLCGFGAGLSWGAASIRWPDDADAAVPGVVEAPFVARARQGADATL